jgi:tyrosine-protein phosphatase SIW14
LKTHKNALFQFALSCALTVSLAAPAAAKTPPATATSQTVALPANIHIDNFGRVSANYFRGAQPTGQDFADLAGLGVKLVIDLAKEGDINERASAERAGMKFVRIPLTTDAQPTQDEVNQFLKLVTDPANQPVYVHCMGGRHRTGVMTAAYRMTQQGWSADQAFAEMKQFKFGADFLHPALKTFVYSFYSGLDKTHAPNVLVAAATPAVQ